MKRNSAVIITMIAALFVCIFSSTTHADIDDLTIKTGCTSTPSYTGLINLEEKSYTAYVKLARRGEKQPVEAYVSKDGEYGNCDRLKSVMANGEIWTKLGVVRGSDGTVLQIASDYLRDIPNANRPKVMLVPKKNAPCRPTVDCSVTRQGQTGIILPTGTLNNRNSLQVFDVTNPDSDAVTQVKYYVDDRVVYSSNVLEPFDMRYVSRPNQTLTRIASYKSGQKIAFTQTVPDNFQDSFSHYLFRLSRYNGKLFFIVTGLIVVSVLAAVLFLLIKVLMSRRNWRIHHGFAPEPKFPLVKTIYYAAASTKLFILVKWSAVSLGLLSLVAVGILFVNSYLLTIFTVDGVSMQHTYKTGDQVLVNKTHKTSADLNGKEYTPKRGDVVIVHAVFGTTDALNQDTTNFDLIKRVVGLPGERVVIKNGVLTVYNNQHPNGLQPDKGAPWEKTMVKDPKNESLDIMLGPSELFVCGDNRPESIDSRFNGPLTTKEVVGNVIANY